MNKYFTKFKDIKENTKLDEKKKKKMDEFLHLANHENVLYTFWMTGSERTIQNNPSKSCKCSR